MRRADENWLEELLEDAYRDFRPELYWLAYLLTGRKSISIEAVSEALDTRGSFFDTWMATWARKVVVAKALAAIHHELEVSRERTRLLEEPAGNLTRDWQLAGSAGKRDLEDALLAIDAMPRCALLLTIFERLPLADAAVLLNAEPELVRKARSIGLRQLVRNLSLNPALTSAGGPSNVFTNEWPYA